MSISATRISAFRGVIYRMIAPESSKKVARQRISSKDTVFFPTLNLIRKDGCIGAFRLIDYNLTRINHYSLKESLSFFIGSRFKLYTQGIGTLGLGLLAGKLGIAHNVAPLKYISLVLYASSFLFLVAGKMFTKEVEKDELIIPHFSLH